MCIGKGANIVCKEMGAPDIARLGCGVLLKSVCGPRMWDQVGELQVRKKGEGRESAS
jgi:hypothetical protein